MVKRVKHSDRPSHVVCSPVFSLIQWGSTRQMCQARGARESGLGSLRKLSNHPLLSQPNWTFSALERSYNLIAHQLKRLPPMWETWVWSLGREDPLEKEMKPTSVFLPGESHGWKSLVGYSPWGHKESDMTERLHFIIFHQMDITYLI